MLAVDEKWRVFPHSQKRERFRHIFVLDVPRIHFHPQEPDPGPLRFVAVIVIVAQVQHRLDATLFQFAKSLRGRLRAAVKAAGDLVEIPDSGNHDRLRPFRRALNRGRKAARQEKKQRPNNHGADSRRPSHLGQPAICACGNASFSLPLVGEMIVTTAQPCKVAYGNFAIGASNINHVGQAVGLFRGCIDGDGRPVWTRVHREFFRGKPGDFDFRPPGKTFMDEYAKFIPHKNGKLGSTGTPPEIRKAPGI